MMNTPICHPIIGDGYYPLNDEELEIELAGAEIIEENPMFEAFTLIVGYQLAWVPLTSLLIWIVYRHEAAKGDE